MKAIFSDRAYASVLAETAEKFKTETGGLFLGTVIGDVWYIVEAIDPGPNSVFEVAYFEYDRAYTQHLIRKTANLYDARLDLIGLWHRHPGSFDIFSSTDDGTNKEYAAMRKEGAVSALVNLDPDFRITVYHVGPPCRYSKLPYEVGDNLFPENLLRFRTQTQYELLMKELLTPAQVGSNRHRSADFGEFLRSVKPFFDEVICSDIYPEPETGDDVVCERILNEVFDDVMFLSDEADMKVSVAQRGKHLALIQEAERGTERVYFSLAEQIDTVTFEYKGKNYFYEKGFLRKCAERLACETAPRPEAEKPFIKEKPAKLSGFLKNVLGGEKR